MSTSRESVLTTIPGSTQRDRLVVVLCHEPGHGSHLELRQQTWADGPGWFNQNSVRVEPHQLADLRNALAGGGRRSPSRVSQSSEARPAAFPRVVRADSA